MTQLLPNNHDCKYAIAAAASWLSCVIVNTISATADALLPLSLCPAMMPLSPDKTCQLHFAVVHATTSIKVPGSPGVQIFLETFLSRLLWWD